MARRAHRGWLLRHTGAVPQLGDLYTRFEEDIRAVGEKLPVDAQDVLTSRFLLESDERFEIYYAPMDWLRPTAKVVVV